MAMVAHAYEVPVLPVGPPEMNGDPEQEGKRDEHGHREHNENGDNLTASVGGAPAQTG